MVPSDEHDSPDHNEPQQTLIVPAPRQNWTWVISAGTLLIALSTFAWSLVKGQIDEVRREVDGVKEFATQGRTNIIREVNELKVQNDRLGANKVENSRLDLIVGHLKPSGETDAQLTAMQKQIDTLENRLNNTIQALDAAYNLINEHLRNHDGAVPEPKPRIKPQPSRQEPHRRSDN
jgi:hypothetical protein